MATRECSECGDYLNISQYSRNQWSRGDGISRCVSCIHGYDPDREHERSPWATSARENNSDAATFSDNALDYPFAEGAFRYVAKGRYTSGSRKGQRCVCKWFKTGAVFEEEYFEKDILAVDKALEIIGKFNQLGIVDKMVKLNVPTVWTFVPDSDWAGRKTLTEPYVDNYEKFNSNTGWNDDSDVWPQVMQALSHFSYHISGGQFVLCDLQGGIYRDFIVLTDPVVLSRRKQFGVTDLGPEGISSFFCQHTCNRFCRPNWSIPRDQRMYLTPVPGTTMMRRGVPLRHSRARQTAHY